MFASKQVLLNRKLLMVLSVFFFEFILAGIAYWKLWHSQQALEVALAQSDAVSGWTAAVSQMDSSLGFLMLVLVVMGTINVGVTVFITQGVVVPLNKTILVANRIAQGKLGNSTDYSATGEVARVRDAVGAMQNRLSDVIHQVAGSTKAVVVGSEQIGQSSQQLRDHMEYQNEHLSRSADTLKAVSDAFNGGADNAKIATTLASEAHQHVKSGEAVLERTVGAMQEVTASSHQIGNIISVIDEIAFQTNLLALNAAVEAARSGEHGKGFAVVANEVRNLAGRSTEAAQRVKQLINESVEKADHGAALVNETVSTLHNVMDSVSRLGEHISSTADNAKEQAEQVGVVSREVEAMEQMMSEGSRLVTTTQRVSQDLDQQTQVLGQVVSHFTLTGAPPVSNAWSNYQDETDSASPKQYGQAEFV